MEIIKDLPEVFEEFAEQRQKSFLMMKELKDKGTPVVGAYCTYFPKEIAMAMGASTVSLAPHLMRQFRKQKKTFRRTYVH